MNDEKLTTIEDVKALTEALASKFAEMRDAKNELINAASFSAPDTLPEDDREVAERFLGEVQRYLDILSYHINHAYSMCHQSWSAIDAYTQGVYTKDKAVAEIRRMWRDTDEDALKEMA